MTSKAPLHPRGHSTVSLRGTAAFLCTGVAALSTLRSEAVVRTYIAVDEFSWCQCDYLLLSNFPFFNNNISRDFSILYCVLQLAFWRTCISWTYPATSGSTLHNRYAARHQALVQHTASCGLMESSTFTVATVLVSVLKRRCGSKKINCDSFWF